MSNDLISRSALLEDFRNTITEQSDTFDWLNMIARQPVAYDLDKVIEDLEDSALAHAMNGQTYGADGYYSLEKEEWAIKRGIEVSIAIVKSKIRI